MLDVREPVLEPVSIEGLRPTQLAVGMREVEEKRKRCGSENARSSASTSAST